MKKYLIVLIASLAALCFSGILTVLWKQNVTAAVAVSKLLPYKDSYDVREKISTNNICTQVYGDACLHYLFDSEQACFSYIEDENIHMVCMYHGDTESYLHLAAPLEEPDGETYASRI